MSARSFTGGQGVGGSNPPLVYASADFDGLELRTLAQACMFMFGESALARALNAGEDPHLSMAANMLGLTYQQAVDEHAAEKQRRTDAREQGLPLPPTPVDDARQAGKVANFGFPGGLGAEKLVLFARKTYKVSLLVDDEQGNPKMSARRLKRIWLETFPEFRRYFDTVSQMVGPEGATFRHFVSGRVRGLVPYTATCNSFFQGLGADATGNVLFLVSEACYTRVPCYACRGDGCGWCWQTGTSALYGTRLVNYIHDDFMIECQEAIGHEVAHELVRIMQVGSSPYLPDVPATAKPQLSHFWSKDAKQVWIEDESSLVRDKKTGKGKRLVAWPKSI